GHRFARANGALGKAERKESNAARVSDRGVRADPPFLNQRVYYLPSVLAVSVHELLLESVGRRCSGISDARRRQRNGSRREFGRRNAQCHYPDRYETRGQ